jgi:hypothetical protein
MDGVVLARAHGVANLVGGLWPLVHIRSFEMVLGPKTDRWLVKTVAGLLIVNGFAELAASSSAGNVRHARRLGVGTAAVLGPSIWPMCPPDGSPRCTSSMQPWSWAGSWPGAA